VQQPQNDTRFAPARWLLKISRGSALLAGVALLLMMFAGAADVIGTNLDMLGLQSRPIPAAFEFMATMMVVTVFFATTLAQSRRSHIRVEALVGLLPGRLRMAFDIFAHGLSAAMWALIAWYAWGSAGHSVSVGEFAPGLINFPVWPARIVLGFGATLMMLQCLFDILAEFDPRFRARDRDVKASIS
jgi:TRAP-type C4-dicarboxylate transport system permease small subunit